MEDLYECFLKPEYTIECVKDFTFNKLNKKMNELQILSKTKGMTDYQMEQLNKLNIELEAYDDDVGNERTIFNKKREQRQLLRKAFVLENKNLLNYMVENYGKLVSNYKNKLYEKKNTYLNEKITCECGEVLSRVNLSRHKLSNNHIRFIENPNEIINREKVILTPEERKKKINDNATEKIKCECGKEVSRANMSKHKLTEKHQLKMSIKEKE